MSVTEMLNTLARYVCVRFTSSTEGVNSQSNAVESLSPCSR